MPSISLSVLLILLEPNEDDSHALVTERFRYANKVFEFVKRSQFSQGLISQDVGDMGSFPRFGASDLAHTEGLPVERVSLQERIVIYLDVLRDGVDITIRVRYVSLLNYARMIFKGMDCYLL